MVIVHFIRRPHNQHTNITRLTDVFSKVRHTIGILTEVLRCGLIFPGSIDARGNQDDERNRQAVSVSPLPGPIMPLVSLSSLSSPASGTDGQCDRSPYADVTAGTAGSLASTIPCAKTDCCLTMYGPRAVVFCLHLHTLALATYAT